jgi:putative membrane protein
MLRRALRCTPSLALCAAAFVSGCSKGDNAADSSRAADSAASAMAPAPAPAPAAPQMTDANILGKLDADNVHDSTGGSLAATKGTSSGVKEFGRMMMKDHHQMRVDGMNLAKTANLTPEAPANDPDMPAMMAAEDSLKSMAKGEAWDKQYIDHNVAGHEKVLAFAQNAANTAQNADLKAMIQKATPTIQKHLDAAKALQAKMGGTSDTTKKP